MAFASRRPTSSCAARAISSARANRVFRSSASRISCATAPCWRRRDARPSPSWRLIRSSSPQSTAPCARRSSPAGAARSTWPASADARAGGVGIEALSRGAPSAVFVERDRHAAIALDENITRLGLGDRARVVRQDVGRALGVLGREGRCFAVVFLDPPYDSPDGASALVTVATGDSLLPGAIVVAQHATKAPLPATPGCLEHWKDRRFGETTLTFFRRGA